jgi:hypothetical protein
MTCQLSADCWRKNFIRTETSSFSFRTRPYMATVPGRVKRYCDATNPFGVDIETWIGREGEDCNPESSIDLIDVRTHARHYIRIVNHTTVDLRVVVTGLIVGERARFNGQLEMKSSGSSWQESGKVQGTPTVNARTFVGARVVPIGSGAVVVRTEVRLQSLWDPGEMIRVDRLVVPLNLRIESVA